VDKRRPARVLMNGTNLSVTVETPAGTTTPRMTALVAKTGISLSPAKACHRGWYISLSTRKRCSEAVSTWIWIVSCR